VGLTQSNIHEVNFEEEVFKGVLFFEEVLQNLSDDVARGKLQAEKRRKEEDHTGTIPTTSRGRPEKVTGQ
jgi:hypothetical protein